MTTIATDGKSMAADGQVVTRTDTIVDTEARKLVRLNDGRILGVAGKRSDLGALAEWLNHGGDKPKFGSDALILGPDGVSYLDEALVPMPASVPTALGSGKDHAITAMDLGFPPERAVEMATKRDPFTGGTITVLFL